MPSVSSDADNVISSTPDADGSSQEMFTVSLLLLMKSMYVCMCVCTVYETT